MVSNVINKGQNGENYAKSRVTIKNPEDVNTMLSNNSNVTESNLLDINRFLWCGINRWRPLWLQNLNNVHVFLAAVCFISCLQASFSGYTSSQVTTLEKRFAIRSSVIGSINSCFEIGYILSVIYVSYVGSRGHVPLWISIGLFLMTAGAFTWTLPHFIFTSNVFIGSNPNASYQVCHVVNDLKKCRSGSCETTLNEKCTATGSTDYAFLPIFIIASFLVGAGSSPILTLTPPFIDDHVPSTKAPAMIASQYAASALGPVVGYALGAILLQYPAEFMSGLTPMNPDDPNWIGAWWAGYVLLGCLVLVGASIMLLFPRKLSEPLSSTSNKSMPILNNTVPLSANERQDPVDESINGQLSTADLVINDIPSNSDICPQSSACHNDAPMKSTKETTYTDDSDDNSDYVNPWPDFSNCHSQHMSQSHFQLDGQPNTSSTVPINSKKKFSAGLVSLFRNHIYLLTSLCISSEMFIIIGFASFLPKYLEFEFLIAKSVASVIAGGVIPCGAFGILAGGWILNHFRFHRKAAVRFILVVNIIIIIFICLFFFLGCNNPQFAGINRKYPKINSPDSNNKMLCNSQCNCDPSIYSPVCHTPTGINYASPCLAGCSKASFTVQPSNDIEERYIGCSCVDPSWSNQTVVAGECDTNCKTLIPFVIALTFLLFLTGIIQNPLIMITMRSVNHSERSFALGLQFVIVRIVANLPSPVIFGSVIDTACKHWRIKCGRKRDCKFVDVVYLNWYITGLCLVVKLVGIFIYVGLYICLRKLPESNQMSMDGMSHPELQPTSNYSTNGDGGVVDMRCKSCPVEGL